MNPKIVMTRDYLPDFIKNDIIFVDDEDTVREVRFRAGYFDNEHIIKTSAEEGQHTRVNWVMVVPSTTPIKNTLNYLMTDAYQSTFREGEE